ncbi:MAG: hypothetical protein K2G69_09255, partial [Muribaculaceae bacterium]|nr:hypothetical protein [Muribaculaceae bacterium]
LTTHQDISGKVDKAEGYGLSKNDFTDALLTKLNGIAAGANNYSHPTGGANTTIAAANGKVLSAITVNNLGHVTSVTGKTLAAADIPTLAISKVSGLQSALDAKLSASVFTELFEKVTVEGKTVIKAKYSLYSVDEMSAYGFQEGTAGSGGVGINETDLAAYLSRNGYATQAWVEGKKYLTSHQSLANYVDKTSEQTITGTKTFSLLKIANTGNGTERPSKGIAVNGILGTMAANDYWAIFGYGTASDSGYMEIATGDNGNEPIYVGQYSGGSPLSASSTRSHGITLMNAVGNQVFNEVTGSKFIKSGGTSTQVLMADGSTKTVHCPTTTTHLGWVGTKGQLTTIDTIAFWNGRFDANSSNLQYCDRGRFGTMATASASDYLKLSGGTMTGVLNLLGNQYADTANTGSLNLNNSDIYGVNSIKFADLSDKAAEGLQWYRDATHIDSLWVKNGVIYFTPNRTWGGTATSNTIWHSGNGGSGSGLDADTVDGVHNGSLTARLISPKAFNKASEIDLTSFMWTANGECTDVPVSNTHHTLTTKLEV